MADDSALRAALMARQAAESARAGKSLFSNPARNAMLGWNATSFPQPRPQPKPQPKPDYGGRVIDKTRQAAQTLQDKLMGRLKTLEETGWGAGVASGYLPGAALKPEVQNLFKDAGGVTAIDIRDWDKMGQDERNGLMLLIDPAWIKAQANPGAELSEEEKAALRAKAAQGAAGAE